MRWTNLLISIIIPVYKVEKYLKRCVESLINQTYRNIEIILVDDGSPDNCGEICDNYKKQDSRIEVIHKTNGGLSDARNVGLRKAKGDYILFVDSDDYIELNACEDFMKMLGSNEVDVAMGDATKIFNCKESKMSFDKTYLGQKQSGKDFLKHQLKNRTMNFASCRNLYKRSYLLANNLYFKKGILHEDEEWLPRVILGTDKVITTGINFYKYIIRENSITQNENKKRNAIDLLNTCYSLEKIYNSIIDIELKQLLNEYLLKMYLSAFYIGKMYDSNSKEYLNDDFLVGKAQSMKCRLQVVIYKLNKYLFYLIYHLFCKCQL